MAIHEFKISTKYLFSLKVILRIHIIWNPQIQVSTNMSNVVKPWDFVPTKLNFTVQSRLSYVTSNGTFKKRSHMTGGLLKQSKEIGDFFYDKLVFRMNKQSRDIHLVIFKTLIYNTIYCFEKHILPFHFRCIWWWFVINSHIYVNKSQ